MDILHGDFETRGVVELRGDKSVGLYNYANHPQTSACMFSWALNGEKPQLWEILRGQPIPLILKQAIVDPEVKFAAWNSPFERHIFLYQLGVDIPASRWVDPQVSARYLSLPDDLETAGYALGLPPDLLKSDKGAQLIKMFSKQTFPRKVRVKKGEVSVLPSPYFRDWNTDPVEWDQFGEYCCQDLVTEREILHRLEVFKVYPLPKKQHRLWILDQKINDRGMPTSRSFVQKSSAIGIEAKKQAFDKQKAATGLENPNSPTQMLEWVKERGYPFNTLRKEPVKVVLDDETNSLTPEARIVLKARAVSSSTSYKKLETILRQLAPDNRLKNQFIFMGSSRAGRWSSGASQLHNMARPEPPFDEDDVLDEVRGLIYAEDFKGLEKFGEPLIAVKSSIRSAFEAPDKKRLNVADLKSIETCVAAWLAKCAPLLVVCRRPDGDAYLEFASKMTGIPYELLEAHKNGDDKKLKAAAKRHRQIAKPAVLGCFEADTLVLTDTGWKHIVDVQEHDLLFDGVDWVRHGGIIDRGFKKVMELNGVKVTPDHKILTGKGWVSAWDVSQDFQLEKQATNLAVGLLSRASTKRNITTSVVVSGADAVCPTLNKILREEKQKVVRSVVMRGCVRREKVFTNLSAHIRGISSTVSRIVTTLLYPVVGVLVPQPIVMEGVEYPANFHLFMSLWRMPSLSRILIDPIFKLTEKIMMGITRKATFASLRRRLTIEIKRRIYSSNTVVRNTALQNSGRNSPQNTEMSGMSLERFGRVTQQNKSSQDNLGVEVLTYDVLNSGPQHRFMVLTNKGPVLVHNCVYRLGAGGWGTNPKTGDRVKIGLWGYAENMGVKMTLEQAQNAVEVFRESYPEIVQLWYDFEKAVFSVLKESAPKNATASLGPDGCIKFDKLNRRGQNPILRMQLPSGRYLHYIDARIENTKMPWKKKVAVDGIVVERDVYKPTLVYAGVNQDTKQWESFVTSHGGKLTENAVQAIARDVLAEGMLRTDEAGMFLVGHVHDELITEGYDDAFDLDYKDLEGFMSEPIDWAPGLPLGADGYSGKYYHK